MVAAVATRCTGAAIVAPATCSTSQGPTLPLRAPSSRDSWALSALPVGLSGRSQLLGRSSLHFSSLSVRSPQLRRAERRRSVCALVDDVPSSSSGGDADELRASDDRRKAPLGLRQFIQSLLSVVRNAMKAALPRLQAFWQSLSHLLVPFCIGLALMIVGSFRNGPPSITEPAHPQMVMYSRFLEHVQSGDVSAVLFEKGTERLYFQLAPKAAASTSNAGAAEEVLEPRRFVTRKVDDPTLIQQLTAKRVEFGLVPQPPGHMLRGGLFTVLAVWLPLVPMYLFFRRDFNGGKRKGSRQSKRSGVAPVTFKDVAGVDAAKAELQDIVACLKDATRYKSLGAQMPSGVLLVGPPGTGKTLLAKAVAGEAGVPFFSAAASEFVEMFVGRGAARVRELFNEARKCAPSVVFIDELDAVGGRRGVSLNEERDQTLNQLLTEMDGFEANSGVVVLAATNRAEMLDPALCRPGRIARRVYVERPNLAGREQILLVHMRGKNVAGLPEILARQVASITPGFAGADLANVVNEAALLAARAGREIIIAQDLQDAVERAVWGIREGGPTRKVSIAVRRWLATSGSTDDAGYANAFKSWFGTRRRLESRATQPGS